MFRVFFALLLIVSMMGCGSKNESEGTHDHSSTGQSRSMIPDKVDTPAAPNTFLRPFFDEQGTVSELAVAPGEPFAVYVVAQYEKPYSMSAAEFSLELPEGVTVLEEIKFFEKALTMGQYDTDFVMGFSCEPPRKFYLMKYMCSTGTDFAGGVVKTLPGVNERDQSYLGFVSCEPQVEKISATGGTATLTRK